MSIPLIYNGRTLALRAIQIVEGPRPTLPRWVADVEGSHGTAHTFDTAVLLAARAADQAKVEEGV